MPPCRAWACELRCEIQRRFPRCAGRLTSTSLSIRRSCSTSRNDRRFRGTLGVVVAAKIRLVAGARRCATPKRVARCAGRDAAICAPPSPEVMDRFILDPPNASFDAMPAVPADRLAGALLCVENATPTGRRLDALSATPPRRGSCRCRRAMTPGAGASEPARRRWLSMAGGDDKSLSFVETPPSRLGSCATISSLLADASWARSVARLRARVGGVPRAGPS